MFSPNYLTCSVCFVELLSVAEKSSYEEFKLPNNETYLGLHVKYLI